MRMVSNHKEDAMAKYTFPYYEGGRECEHVVEADNNKAAFAELFRFLSEKPGRTMTRTPIRFRTASGERTIPSPIAPAVSA